MTTPISSRSTVCALVPHYECQQWLSQAIESLLGQTRPPDAVVVMDDASERAPLDIVGRYPGVTLVGVADNGGPYRLVQAVIDATDYDAYLFQDADDWSAPTRLDALIAEAERSGAELIGSSEVRILVEEGDVVEVAYPHDVNAALAQSPASYPLLHPTSLVSADLVRRLSGFATGMRFSGDAEFLRRAGHCATIVNTPKPLYFRRKRRGSLTLGSDTALGSPARQSVQSALEERAQTNADRVSGGVAPDLTPWRLAPPAALCHLSGPPLGEPSRPRRSASTVPSTAVAVPGAATRDPVFVVGAPRSGHGVVGWALGQHPAFDVLADSRWLARASGDIEFRAVDTEVPAPEEFHDAISGALRNLIRRSVSARPVASGSELLTVAHALATQFPDARFVHVVRDIDDAVAAIAHSPTSEGSFLTGERVWRAWHDSTTLGIAVERALGSSVVLRIRYSDLVSRPEATMRRCLEFLGEPFDPACLRPLTDVSTSLWLGEPDAEPSLVDRCRALSEFVHQAQPAAAACPDALQSVAERFARDRRGTNAANALFVDRVRNFVNEAVPEGARVAMVSRGDPRLVDLDERIAWHLPQVEDGTYAGHHPADSGEAVDQLLSLQARGADYLAIPATSLWWLTWYEGLRGYLTEAATLVAFHQELGAVYRLRAPVVRPTGNGPAPPRFVALPEPVMDVIR